MGKQSAGKASAGKACAGKASAGNKSTVKKSAGKASAGKVKKPLKPKSKCCLDRPRCRRCPIRKLKEGTLPWGYTAHKRKLVTVEKAAAIKAAKQAKKAGRAA